MNGRDNTSRFGEPTIKLAGLRLWIHGRQYPQSDDYWDGNWLNVTVHCGAPGADVWASGSIVHLTELAQWKHDCETLNRTLEGQANLECMEPNLAVRITSKRGGQLDMEVEVTPDRLTQNHTFRFEIDQSFLPTLAERLRKILESFPLRIAGENGR